VIQRPLQQPLEAEGALPFHPQQSWAAITSYDRDKETGGLSTARRTLTVINRGLPEYEVLRDPEGLIRITSSPVASDYPKLEDDAYRECTIAVTLLRCVGRLSGRGDGPGTPTPDAQCLGKHRFQFAMQSTHGDWKQGQVWKQAHQFNVPLVAVQCPPDAARPAARSFVTVEPAELVVTAIKRAEDRDTLILRFFNITDEPVTDNRIAVPGAKQFRLVNLNEGPQEEWRGGDSLTMSVGPNKIVTVEFEL
jgi:hypothetical protein